MARFKYLLDTCDRQDLDHLCQQYEGFQHFAALLENLAEGIASGDISVPQ